MKKIVSIIALFLSMVFVFAFAGCSSGGANEGDGEGEGKTVARIEMATEPNDTELSVGDQFSPEGGSIEVYYEDGTSEVLPLTAEGVTLSSINTERVGTRTVTVTFGGKKTTFKVYITEQGFTVTFNYNYEGAPASGTQTVLSGETAEKPEDPEREGYTFYAWYTDEQCMQEYDFEQDVEGDLTLYAEWKENGATYYDVTFDVNYYGVVPSKFVKIIKSGENAVIPDITMQREGFTFDGWYSDEALTEPFAADAVIEADTYVRAKWTKTLTGIQTYIFEAEDTDLTGKIGPGLSGTAQEDGMIISGNETASGEKYVGFLYQNGLTLDFYFASSETVTDAVITISVAAEMDNIDFTSDEYQVILNGTPLSYSDVSLASDSKFTDAIVISGVTLKEGANSIILKTNNTKRPMGDASTYAATAPMVDCIKIETSAVLIWDANKGLPMEY